MRLGFIDGCGLTLGNYLMAKSAQKDGMYFIQNKNTIQSTYRTEQLLFNAFTPDHKYIQVGINRERYLQVKGHLQLLWIQHNRYSMSISCCLHYARTKSGDVLANCCRDDKFYKSQDIRFTRCATWHWGKVISAYAEVHLPTTTTTLDRKRSNKTRQEKCTCVIERHIRMKHSKTVV